MNTPSSRSVAILTFIAGLTLASEGFARPKGSTKRPAVTAPHKAGKGKAKAAPAPKKPEISQEELNDEELDLLREVMQDGCGAIYKDTDISKITAYAKKLEQAGKGQRALTFLDIVKKLQAHGEGLGGETAEDSEKLKGLQKDCDELRQEIERAIITACYRKSPKEEQYRLAGYLYDDMDNMENGTFGDPAPDQLVNASLQGKKREITVPLIDADEFNMSFKLNPEEVPKGASELEKTRIGIENRENARWKKEEEASARANEIKARTCITGEMNKRYPESAVRAKVRNVLGRHLKEQGFRGER
ncbi:MAG: hypothetical protein UT33_C0007G0061 [Candidatus Peregrinibacteria bacterium GW2011_GWC2_39_14]|nr:MAG: hypothetical protein US92_C0002G0062 [Candidatus Peregrinibacteria bacterium GW2011_GWA2_38_36]KKR06873.1 MAG: hypothetical protein UT33_C0007G0061 [Candidatus Peregrinibacteria bacterium GW2011_GWC2_39_14]